MKKVKCPYCDNEMQTDDLFVWYCLHCLEKHRCPECDGTGDGGPVMGCMCKKCHGSGMIKPKEGE